MMHLDKYLVVSLLRHTYTVHLLSIPIPSCLLYYAFTVFYVEIYRIISRKAMSAGEGTASALPAGQRIAVTAANTTTAAKPKASGGCC
jgi:hypothetical protein